MIQANVLSGGDMMEKALLYREPAPELISYLNNNLNSIIERGSSLSNRFVDTMKGLYNSVYSDSAIRASKQLLAQAEISLSENSIYVVPENSLHKANYIMQQYIMSEPTISEMYRKNLVQGYPDTFYDRQPDTFGENRYDYQAVMSDILQHDKEGNGYFMAYSNTDDKEELDFYNKLTILDTWKNVSNILAKGIDPTDSDLE